MATKGGKQMWFMCKSSQRGFQEGTKRYIVPGTRNHKEVQEVQVGTRGYYGWRYLEVCLMQADVLYAQECFSHHEPTARLSASICFIYPLSQFWRNKPDPHRFINSMANFQPVGIELMQTLSLFHPGGFLEASDVHQLLYVNTFRRGGLSGVQIAPEFRRNGIFSLRRHP